MADYGGGEDLAEKLRRHEAVTPSRVVGRDEKAAAWYALEMAGVVELADTGDLKSPASQGAYGFDPRLRQSSGKKGGRTRTRVHRQGGPSWLTG
jgi:hypothetical protein